MYRVRPAATAFVSALPVFAAIAGARPVTATAGTVTVKVTGVGGVPSSGVASVALNIAAHGLSGSGYMVVHPSGATAPTPNALDCPASPYVYDLITVKVGTDGQIKITNKGSVTVQYYPTTPSEQVRYADMTGDGTTAVWTHRVLVDGDWRPDGAVLGQRFG